LTTSSLVVGRTYRLTGVAGQRATHKGALDGYRLWLRDRADVVVIGGPTASPTPAPSPRPSATPRPGATGSPTPRPTSTAAAPTSIAHALVVTDRDVAIEAVVTAGANLLDTSGRRIVVQDASGAIEVLLPKDAPDPGAGARIRAVGRIGAAYGAPRLRAVSVVRRGSGAMPAALVVDGALSDAHVWRLVSMRGHIEDVRKLGDRWRAEVLVGSQRILVTGQPGAGIPVASVIEGRDVRLVGIVRRAYPSASDRRPTLLPRSPADVDVVAAGSSAAVSGTGGGGTGASGSGTGSGNAAGGAGTAAGSGAGTPGGSGEPAIPDVDLVDLAEADGRTVRVGGLVSELAIDGFRLDDGTAVGRVVLAGEAASLLPLIEPADAINVVGRVARLDDGALGVVVTDPAGIALGSDLGVGATPAAATSGAGASSEPDPSPSGSPAVDVLSAGAIGGSALPGAGAGLATLLTVTLISVAVTLIRRRQARRFLAARVAARLAAIAGVPVAVGSAGPDDDGSAPPPAPATAGAERGPSVA
jgi:hypothetical protein